MKQASNNKKDTDNNENMSEGINDEDIDMVKTINQNYNREKSGKGKELLFEGGEIELTMAPPG